VAYGTYSVADLLANTNTVVQIGEDNVFETFDAALAAHNEITRDLVQFAEVTTDRRRRFGGNDEMQMDPVDEFGRADAQKTAVGQTLDFPIYINQISTQWTRDYFRRATGAEIAKQFVGIQDADTRAFARDLKRAIFTPTNRTVVDRTQDYQSLAVKALANADSTELPLGPNGESFNGATHTHYLYTASTTFAAADLTALITAVMEHHVNGEPKIYINVANEAEVRGLTGFYAYTDARLVIPGGSTTTTAGAGLDMRNVNNRAIGVFGAAEVIVKPWMPSGYAFATVQGGPAPLVRRVDPITGGNLEMVVDNETFPLRARTFERRYGFGVYNRTNGAVLYRDSGGAAAYVAPTIT
jgi:hypothetical protein